MLHVSSVVDAVDSQEYAGHGRHGDHELLDAVAAGKRLDEVGVDEVDVYGSTTSIGCWRSRTPGASNRGSAGRVLASGVSYGVWVGCDVRGMWWSGVDINVAQRRDKALSAWSNNCPIVPHLSSISTPADRSRRVPFFFIETDRRSLRACQVPALVRLATSTTATTIIDFSLSLPPYTVCGGRRSKLSSAATSQPLPPATVASVHAMAHELCTREGMRTKEGHCDSLAVQASNVLPSKTPPIARLPNELLTSVFAIVADLDEPRTAAALFGLPAGPQTFMKWVRLMLVCWHWRRVGLSSPWLWRRISVTRNLESLEFRLLRTEGCTIDLFPRNDPATNEAAMPLVLRFASSIRSIQIDEPVGFDALPSIKPLFEVSLPSLESVVLLSGQSMWSRFDTDSPDESKGWFDLGLSRDLQPRLCTLQIHRIVIPSPPAFFSTLRDLSIDLKGLKSPSLSSQDIINVLAHSPRLEALRIFSSPTWIYPSGLQVLADIEPDSQSRCSLPHLREVFLRCPYRFAAPILQVIDAPNLAELRVEAFTSTHVIVDKIGSDLLPPSLRHIVPRFSKLRLVPNQPSGFYIGGSASLVPGGRYRSGDRNCFRVDIAVQDSSSWVAPSLGPALTTLCNIFAGAPLEQLDIGDFDDVPPSNAWKRLYTTFPTVASLRLACSASVVDSFLLEFLKSSTEGLWLTLRRLSVSTAHKDYEPLDSSEVYDIFELVLDVLHARRERDASDLVITLEHAMKRWTPLFPHRWMLHTIRSLCGGKFTLRRCEDSDNSRGFCRPFEVELSELFAPAEWRRSSGKSGETERGSDEGEMCEMEDRVDPETSTTEDLPLDNNTMAGARIHADDLEEAHPDEYSMLQSKVLEELRQTVAKTVGAAFPET